jgi:hypothetical protein
MKSPKFIIDLIQPAASAKLTPSKFALPPLRPFIKHLSYSKVKYPTVNDDSEILRGVV